MGSWGKDNKKHVIARSVATWQSIFFGITRLRRSALPLFRLHTPHNKADPLIADRLPTNAERKGFEPLERKAFNGFRDRPDRPLRHLSKKPCGDRGIRTPEAFRLNGFQDRRYRPLSHISAAKIQLFAFMQLIRRKKKFYLCIFNAFQVRSL